MFVGLFPNFILHGFINLPIRSEASLMYGTEIYRAFSVDSLRILSQLLLLIFSDVSGLDMMTFMFYPLSSMDIYI